MTRKLYRRVMLIAVMVLLGSTPAIGFPTSLTDVRIGRYSDHTRVVLETSGKTKFDVIAADREISITVDADAKQQNIAVKRGLVSRVTVDPEASTTRVGINLTQ